MKEQRKNRKRVETIKKELVEVKQNKESKISQSIIFLFFLCLCFSDDQRLKKEGNMIINNGVSRCDNCILDYQMKKVYYYYYYTLNIIIFLSILFIFGRVKD